MLFANGTDRVACSTKETKRAITFKPNDSGLSSTGCDGSEKGAVDMPSEKLPAATKKHPTSNNSNGTEKLSAATMNHPASNDITAPNDGTEKLSAAAKKHPASNDITAPNDGTEKLSAATQKDPISNDITAPYSGIWQLSAAAAMKDAASSNDTTPPNDGTEKPSAATQKHPTSRNITWTEKLSVGSMKDPTSNDITAPCDGTWKLSAAPMKHPKSSDIIAPNDGSGAIPTKFDVLYGRGDAVGNHEGNVRFRKLVESHWRSFKDGGKVGRNRVWNLILERIRSVGGRFLQLNDGQWEEVGDKQAKSKICQAIRSYIKIQQRPRRNEKNSARSSTKALPTLKSNGTTQQPRQKQAEKKPARPPKNKLAVAVAKHEHQHPIHQLQNSQPPIHQLLTPGKSPPATSGNIVASTAGESGAILPTEFDVLCGRGNGAMQHEGNVRFRKMVESHWRRYRDATTNVARNQVGYLILNKVHSAGGRFLQFNERTEQWDELGDKKAKSKICQAMRDTHIKVPPTQKSSGPRQERNRKITAKEQFEDSEEEQKQAREAILRSAFEMFCSKQRESLTDEPLPSVIQLAARWEKLERSQQELYLSEARTKLHGPT